MFKKNTMHKLTGALTSFSADAHTPSGRNPEPSEGPSSHRRLGSAEGEWGIIV